MMDSTHNAAIIAEYKKHHPACERFAERITDLLNDYLVEHKNRILPITHRVKNVESLESKLIRKNSKYKSLHEITDIVGIRITTFYEDTIDLIAPIIEEKFRVDWEKTIDKRKAIDPNRFGYLSLHYIVSVSDDRKNLDEYYICDGFQFEIQMRSILQHAWAEIEHDTGYKSEYEVPRDVRRDFSRLAGLLELADKEFISIRNKLEAYKQVAAREVENESLNLLIDNVSLAAYISESANLKNLNAEIVRCSSTELRDDAVPSESRVKELLWVGFTTIDEVDKSIAVNHDLCVYLACSRLAGKKRQTVSKVIGLFYLCYAVLVQEKDHELLLRYLEENGIGDDDVRDIFAHELIASYNEYENLKNTQN